MSTLFIPRRIRLMAREYAAQGKTPSILNDTVFKAVFGSEDEDSRDALRSLLSACTRRQVSQVRLLNTELLPEYLTGKTIRLDIHATFNDGEQADLEMQVGGAGDDLRARASLYAARLLSGQAARGKSYRGLKRVYQVFFLDGVLFPRSMKLAHRFTMKEEETGECLNGLMEIIFYELPKASVVVEGCMGGGAGLGRLREEEKWCIYMKYRHECEAEGLIGELCRGEEGIMKAERALRKVYRDEERWARALFREKAAMDYRSAKMDAKMDLKEAREEGLAEGRQEILNLLKSGKPPEEILKDFGNR
jgi:predicted transposase/invertase (TIGR01784 family)